MFAFASLPPFIRRVRRPPPPPPFIFVFMQFCEGNKKTMKRRDEEDRQTELSEEGIWRRRGEEIQNRRLHPRRWRWQRADWLWRSALQFLPARGWPALPCLALPRHVMSLTSIIVSNAAYYPLGGERRRGDPRDGCAGARRTRPPLPVLAAGRGRRARGWVAPPHVEEEYSVITCCQF